MIVLWLAWAPQVRAQPAGDPLPDGTASGAPSAAPSPECFPACRAGFICHQGACVSLCNPPCPSGYACSSTATCEAQAAPTPPATSTNYPQQPAYVPPAISTIGPASPYSAQPIAPAQERLEEPHATRSSGFEAVFFAGVHSYFGDYGDGMPPGLRLGTLLGGRLNPVVSLAGALEFDAHNLDAPPPGVSVTSVAFLFSFAPSFKFSQESRIKFIITPRLGAFARVASATDRTSTVDATATGLLLGSSFTLAFPAGPVLLGPMLSIEHQSIEQVCVTVDGTESCSDSSADLDSGTVGALQFAVWL